MLQPKISLVFATVLVCFTRAATDYGMKLQQTLGSARAVRQGSRASRDSSTTPTPYGASTAAAHCVIIGTQAADTYSFDTAVDKLDQLTALAVEWRAALLSAKADAAAPAMPEATPEPGEKIEFSVNSTHVPEKCLRKSEDGAVMKVHYVGKLVATGKIFASSFHTGSQPLRFVLGSDEVVAGWNRGLGNMCEGERRRLMVPYDLGYGEKGAKGVPPYSDLQYDFELVELSLPKLSAQNTHAKKQKKKRKKEEL